MQFGEHIEPKLLEEFPSFKQVLLGYAIRQDLRSTLPRKAGEGSFSSCGRIGVSRGAITNICLSHTGADPLDSPLNGLKNGDRHATRYSAAADSSPLRCQVADRPE